MLPVLDRGDDRSNPLDDKERYQYHRQGQYAGERPRDQYYAENDRQHRGQKRPGKARRLPRTPHPDRPEEPGDKEQPADKYFDGQCSQDGHCDRQKAQNHHDDALGQKQLPMSVDRQSQLAAQPVDICLVAHLSTALRAAAAGDRQARKRSRAARPLRRGSEYQTNSSYFLPRNTSSYLPAAGQTTPSLRSRSTSPALIPSHSPNTSAVCSPSSGAGLTGAGAPSKRTGKVGMRSSPLGCRMVWMMPRFSKLGSPNRSPVSSTAPAGGAAPHTRRSAPCLSCCRVQSEIVRSISASCRPCSPVVAKRGSSVRSSCPMTFNNRCQCSGLAGLVKT